MRARRARARTKPSTAIQKKIRAAREVILGTLKKSLHAEHRRSNFFRASREVVLDTHKK